MEKILKITWVLILILSTILSNAQTNLKGIVLDANSKERLIGAYVILEGTSFGTATDIDGRFFIANIPQGDYSVLVSYIGYKSFQEKIEVTEVKLLDLKFELEFEGHNLGAVEVTAQAKGQMRAINDQLNSNSIVNVVSSERIQELPDANAAETVGRISGVSVLRSGGEGNKVVIRGLSPKYNKITMEGVSMAGGEGDRSTDISMISPYSLEGIEVLKSAMADKDADFIGGSVNFKLRSAPKGLHYDFVGQGAYNQLKGTASDYMFVSSISNRFFKDRIGVYFQMNLEKRNRSSNRLLADYRVRNDAEIDKEDPVYIQFLQLTDAFRQRYRKGGTLVFDYKIKNGSVHFKNIYSNGLTEVLKYKQKYQIEKRKHVFEARDESYMLQTWSNIFDFEKRLGGFTLDGAVSYAKADNTQPNSLGFVFAQDGALTSNVQDEAISPETVYQFANLDFNKTYFNSFSEEKYVTSEQQLGVSINLKYDFVFNKLINGNLKTGFKIRRKNRLHDRSIFGGDLQIASGQSGNNAIIDALPWVNAEVEHGNRLPFTLFNKEINHRDFLEGKYGMIDVVDLNKMHEALDVIHSADGLSQDAYFEFERSSNTFDYSGKEDYWATYLMLEINLGNKVKFIPGVRYEKNNTEFTGVKGITNLAFPERNYIKKDTTVYRDNSFLLPMIHLKYNPFQWMDVRVAYTHTLSRPSYDKFMPRRDVWANIVSWNNYDLKPEFAKNLDLYVSFHENHIGLFSVGAFSKSIDNMIMNLGKRVILNPSDHDLGDEYKFKSIYTFSNNEETAYVKGLEFDWQMNFWFLPKSLKGLVLNFNYTHILSEAKYPITIIENHAEQPWDPPVWVNIDDFYTSQLINQPDDIVNIQLGYDFKGFSSRISMLYQSKTFKKAEFSPEEAQFSDDYIRWDLSIKQKLPWYSLQVFCNMNNISGAKDIDLVRAGNWDASIQHYGFTVDFGLRMKL